MSYQVLARKYRPSTFAELEGQEHVLRALINALEQNRLHHAYLFAGTRGVGKTTIARILAKCLNCEQGVTATPCGECGTCTEISQGRNIDLIEVDAASRTGIDDMRELLDNVQYMPTCSRFKIYLIDEVHMLSKPAVISMLKTLEEPPEHVKFLFATTEPKKLPVTVLSRCLQFNLKNLPPERIVNYLKQLLPKEGIEFEDGALWQIGRAADGSMRDALSLTDQAISFSKNFLTDDAVKSMLGNMDQREIYELLDALISEDGTKLLDTVDRIAQFAPDYSALLDDLLGVLHRIAVTHAVPDGIDNSQGDRDLVVAVADSVSREDIQLFYQIGLIGKRDLPMAPDPRSGFEMVLLRMLAFTLDVKQGKVTNPGGNTTVESPIADLLSTLDKKPATTPVIPAQAGTDNRSDSSIPPVAISGDWQSILRQLELGGVTQILAANCTLGRSENNHCHLLLNEQQASLWNKKHESRISQALTKLYGQEIKVSIEVGIIESETPAQLDRRQREENQARAVTAIEGDKNIQELIRTFNGTLDRKSIAPVDHAGDPP